MERYKNSKIYMLLGKDKFFYIGSTCMPLSKRLHSHKARATQINSLVYKHFNALGWEKVDILCINTFTLNSKKELLVKEQEEIQKHKDNPYFLNQNNAVSDNEETQRRRLAWEAKKITCENCNRIIRRSFLNKHLLTNICLKNSVKKITSPSI